MSDTVPTSASVALIATQVDDVVKLANGLVKSGQFKGVTNVNVAVARIMLGADLGMSPTQALMGIDLVKGNPQIRGVALGRMVRERANYDYDIVARDFTEGEEGAIVALYRRDPDSGEWPTARRDTVFQTSMGPFTVFEGDRLPKGVEAFKLSQARKRGLIRDDGAWGSQPEVMVVWRALSQAVRFHAPDVIGGMPVYTEADSFHPIVTAGTGDGEPPEWQGIEPARVDQIESVMWRARDLNYAPASDVVAVRQRLNGQPREVIDRWIADETMKLDALAAKSPEPETVTDADVVTDPALTLTIGGDVFEFDGYGEAYDRITAVMERGDKQEIDRVGLEMAGAHDRIMEFGGDPQEADWYARLASALHTEAGDTTAPDPVDF